MMGVGGLVLNERVSLLVEGCAVVVDFFCFLSGPKWRKTAVGLLLFTTSLPFPVVLFVVRLSFFWEDFSTKRLEG